MLPPLNHHRVVRSTGETTQADVLTRQADRADVRTSRERVRELREPSIVSRQTTADITGHMYKNRTQHTAPPPQHTHTHTHTHPLSYSFVPHFFPLGVAEEGWGWGRGRGAAVKCRRKRNSSRRRKGIIFCCDGHHRGLSQRSRIFGWTPPR